ncbi:MAG: hypothetical protein IPO93_00940 [Actinobacteria bacterium]|nr:hypothetical protein [Actinomycetota bacterium]
MGTAAWICSPEADVALRVAQATLAEHPTDPLAVGTAVRRALPGISSDQVAAAIQQATMRRAAAERYAIDARDLFLTRDGLEQATRPAVAARRAGLLTAAGAQTVLDLTAGLGFDTRAFLEAGLDVVCVERDPTTARFLAHNAPRADVIVGDATDARLLADLLGRLDEDDVVFVDPARRDPLAPRGITSMRARPERDPERWSPPWAYVAAIPHPRVAAKVAPSFRPPVGWQAEWASVQRTVVECAVYSWPALPVASQAAIFGDDDVLVLGATGDDVPVASAVATWLHEPDPAVLRAGAVSAVIDGSPGMAMVDVDSTWLTSSTAPPAGLGLRSYRVIAEILGDRKHQRRDLERHGVTRAVVKCRDTADDPVSVLRTLGLLEGPGHVLVMTRRAGRTVSYLAEPASQRPA